MRELVYDDDDITKNIKLLVFSIPQFVSLKSRYCSWMGRLHHLHAGFHSFLVESPKSEKTERKYMNDFSELSLRVQKP